MLPENPRATAAGALGESSQDLQVGLHGFPEGAGLAVHCFQEGVLGT